MLHCCLTLPFLARNLIFVPLYILWGFLPSVLLLRFCYNCFELCDCDRPWCRVFVCVFLTLGLCWASFICAIILFIMFGKFGAIISSIIWLSLPHLTFRDSVYLYIRLFEVLQLTAALLVFFFSFFCYVLEFTNLLFAKYILLLTPLSVFFYFKHYISYFSRYLFRSSYIFCVSTLNIWNTVK